MDIADQCFFSVVSTQYPKHWPIKCDGPVELYQLAGSFDSTKGIETIALCEAHAVATCPDNSKALRSVFE